MAGLINTVPSNLPNPGQDVSKQLSAAATAEPSAPPEQVLAVAKSSATPQDAQTGISATTAYSQASQAADALSQMNQIQQYRAFSKYSQQQKQLMVAAGYDPPKAPGNRWGLFGEIPLVDDIPVVKSVVGAVGHYTIGDTLGALGKQHWVHDTLNAVESPQRFASHWYRTGAAEEEQNAFEHNEDEPISPFLKLFAPFVSGPNDFGHMWDETSHGESYINPIVKKSALSTFGPNVYQYAINVATVAKGSRQQLIQQMIANAPQEQQAQLAQLLVSPQFQNAVQMLDAGKASFGRDFADVLFGDNDATYAHPESRSLAGASDGVFDAVSDPTQYLGGIGDVLKANRAVVSGDDFRRAYQTDAGFKRWADTFGPKVAESASRASQLDPVLRTRGLAQLMATGTATPETEAAQLVAKAQVASDAESSAAPAGQEFASEGSLPYEIPSKVAQFIQPYDTPVTDGPSLVNYLSSMQDGISYLRRDRVFGKEVALLPKLGPVDRLRLLAKEAGLHTIDTMAQRAFYLKGVGSRAIEAGELSPETALSASNDNSAADLLGKDPSDLTDEEREMATRLGSDGQAVVNQIRPGGLADRTIMGTGRLLKAMTTIPHKTKFDPLNYGTYNHLYDSLRLLLPDARAHDLMDTMMRTKSIGAQKILMGNIWNEFGAAAGMKSDVDTWEQWLQSGKDLNTDVNYAMSGEQGLDTIPIAGQDTPMGIYRYQQTREWAIPNAKEAYLAGKKAGVFNILGAGVNLPAITKAVGMWSNAQLLRLAFGLRVAPEELFSFLLRNSPINIAQARAGASSIKHYEKLNEILADQAYRQEYMQLGEDKSLKNALSLEEDPEDPMAQLRQRRTVNVMRFRRLANDILDDQDFVKAASFKEQLIHSLPKKVQTGIVNPIDLLHEVVNSKYQEVFAKVERRFAGQQIRDVIDRHQDLFNNAYTGHIITEAEINPYNSAATIGDTIDRGKEVDASLTGHADRTLTPSRQDMLKLKNLSAEQLRQAARSNLRRFTGSYERYDLNNPIFHEMWHYNLSTLLADDWGSAALKLVGNSAISDAEREEALAAILTNDDAWSALSARSIHTSTGLSAEDGQLTVRAAAVDHARVMLGDVTNVLGKDDEENVNRELAKWMTDNGHTPSVRALMGRYKAPDYINGPTTELIKPGSNGVFTHFTNNMWNKIGHQINWISREPVFLHNLVRSHDLFQTTENMLKEYMRPEDAEELTNRLALQSAADMTVPYIHNPELKSQFSSLTKNLMPFYFAEEQFWKRWARVARYDPVALRRAQLVFQAVTTSGFVQRDPTTGQQVFTYPGSQLITDALSPVLSAVGLKNYIGDVPITGTLQGLSPGLNTSILGGRFGPLITIPATFINDFFPETGPSIAKLTGEQQQGLLRDIFPASVMHVIDFTMAMSQDSTNTNMNSTYSDAFISALRMMAANGQLNVTAATTNLGQTGTVGPPSAGSANEGDYITDANGTQWVAQSNGKWLSAVNNAVQTQNVLTRATNTARILVALKAVFGFSAPSAPEFQGTPISISDDLQTYLNSMPIDDALTAYIAANPDATPFSTFATKSATGEPLPATAATLKWESDNSSWSNRFSGVSAYMIPSPDTSGPFDISAYSTQIQEGLRQQDTPNQFYQQIIYNNAASIYYDQENQYYTALAQVGKNKFEGDKLESQWNNWAAQFMQSNPVFDQMYTSQNGSANRQLQRQTLEKALLVRDAPTGPQATATLQLLQMYDKYQSVVKPLNVSSTSYISSARKDELGMAFAQQVMQFVSENPSVEAVFNSLIRPDIDSDVQSVAQTNAMYGLIAAGEA